MTGRHGAPPAAGSSPVHRLPAEVKVAAALAFVIVVAVTPRRALPVLAMQGLAIGAVVGVARLPLGFVVRRLAVVAPFLVAAALTAVVAGGPHVTVGPLSLSEPGMWAGAAIGAKTLIGALTSIAVAGTTPIPDLLSGLGRLGLPGPLVALAGFTLRYLDLVADGLARRRTAMTARGYRPRRLTQAGPLAASLGTMFVHTYERGERVHAAMLSRGFTGAMPVVAAAPRPRPWHWAAAAALPAVAAVALAVGWAGLGRA
ncbi:MAG: cobalt ECF transporter T component CbiQ [Acidimicrobiales bacterium]